MSEENDLNQPLNQSDAVSVGSMGSRGGSSLLERIKAKREREAAAKAASSDNGASSMELIASSLHSESQFQPTQPFTVAPDPPETYPSGTMEVMTAPPSYGPVNNNSVTGSQPRPNAWSKMFHPFRGSSSGEAGESLLREGSGSGQEDQHADDEGYSMTGYFQTFVNDVYSMFRSIPLWGQILALAVMLFIVYKLI